MPRRGSVERREVTPDPIYHSLNVSRFVNKIMYSGKKVTAQGEFYRAMEIIKEKSGKDPLEVFEQAIKNAMPVLEVKARRVGGATYQVPVEVRADRRLALALRWLIQYSRARGERGFENKLAAELMDAAANTGSTVKKREDTHKMAEANKAFAHYRW
ncbi:MAG TPA: 30S ribosomal protein S7 [Bacillota bacterium]|jgi:small subunit ribosomal protein S7